MQLMSKAGNLGRRLREVCGDYARACASGRAKAGIVFPGMVGFALAWAVPQAHAQSFGSCTSRLFMEHSSGGFYEVKTQTSPFQYQKLGQLSEHGFNAIAYNPSDHYIYFMWRNGADRRLYRIGANGVPTVANTIRTGYPNGFPDGTRFYSGTFTNATGILYTMTVAPDVLYSIDVRQPSVWKKINLSRRINTEDIAWTNGKMYAVENNGQLISINPSNGQVTNIGAASGPTGEWAALWGASNGLFGSRNKASGFYHINTSNGKKTLLSSSHEPIDSDGTMCHNAPLRLGTDLSITKTNGRTQYVAGNTTYTMVVRNNGPFTALDATVNDPLPRSISTASWTCAAAGGGVCKTASGTGAINNVKLDLPAGATATFKMTINVPASYTGNLVNTATVAVGAINTDTNTSNNTATDTDVSPARLIIAKVSTGGVGSFKFSGTNGVPAQTLTTQTAGTRVTGTTRILTATGTATTVTETSSPSDFALTGIACTGLGSGGKATPNLANRTVTLDKAATAPGTTITCTFTSARQRITDVALAKTSQVDTVASGGLLLFTLTLTNNGPLDVTNVRLTDTPEDGLDCLSPSPTATCSATQGATCPGSAIQVSELLGAGALVPNLPVGGSVAVTLQCRAP